MLGHEPPYQGLPFDKSTFVDKSEKAVDLPVENKDVILQLDTYTITRAPLASEEEKSWPVPPAGEVLSPDGRWFASVRDYNLSLRSTDNGHLVKLTTDGAELYRWGARREGQSSPNRLLTA